MESLIDQPRDVREGEELDLQALDRFLAERLPELGGPLRVRQYPGGHSNLTYLVRKGERELVLRRPPHGGERIKTAHDMGREFRILSGLADVYPKAPRPLALCEETEVLGAPFYLMERRVGVILRGHRPPVGFDLSANLMQALSRELIDLLAQLHAVDVARAGLSGEGHPEGYVERQVDGWTRRYEQAKTDDVPQVEQVARWLAENRPAEAGAALVHGDFKYDNLVLDPADLSRVVAILDWEMATVGDPLMDLGTTLGYWIDPDDPPGHRMLPLGPTLLPGNLSRPELVERYAAQTGRELSNVLFYYVFGLFKIVVIAQQIYKRFKDGLTHDARFASMIMGVQILGRTAATALERGRIHGLG